VHEILTDVDDLRGCDRSIAVREIRQVLDKVREEIQAGRTVEQQEITTRVQGALIGLEKSSLRAVINATGVILHTNLGRAPLAPFKMITGYSNLEYDLDSGRRGCRDIHIAGLLQDLLGRPGIAVNNNASAIYLVLNELSLGREVIISRGELVEIGDGFRIPEIMTASGARLVEVGTTNRTRIEDYRKAVSDRTSLLLRVHPSNFQIRGFTSRPDLKELVALGKERGIPVYEDLGSGCLINLKAFSIKEPLVQDSLSQGVNLVSFSGDKLLGGPQAGLVVGDPDLVRRVRRNAMFRAFRLDKIIYQALETTLRNLLINPLERIPILRMVSQSSEVLLHRAESLAKSLTEFKAAVKSGESYIGGGSTPAQSLPTWLVLISCRDAGAVQGRLRRGQPPVIARIEQEQLVLDIRTVFPDEEDRLSTAIVAAVKGDLVPEVIAQFN